MSSQRTVRLRRRFLHASAALSVLAAGVSLVGFTQIRFDSTGPGFHWQTPVVTYVIQSAGSDDISDKSEETAIRLGFKAWEQVNESVVRFTEDTNADRTRTDFDADDIHLVLFDEDGSTGFFPAGSNIIALTPLTASTADGRILDADILFNGQLTFTTNPGSNTSRFDVQAVLTHEVGHFIGLDHSAGPRATLFTTIPGGTTYARSLCKDDEAAAAVLYPSGSSNRTAVIQGRVTQTVSGNGLAFAQVVAVTSPGGEYAGQALSDANGNYRIQGLEAGSYQVYAEPVDGPFQLSHTIGFKSQTSTSFQTKWAPQGTVTLSSGQVLGLSFSSLINTAINISSASGGKIEIGGSGTVTLGGSGLGEVASVRVTGTGVNVESTQSPNASTLIVTLAASTSAAPGVRTIEVTRGDGQIAVLTAGVEVIAPRPTITQVTPTQLVASGGESLTIFGTGFTAGSQVVVGGQLATGITLVSPTELRCITPTSPGVTNAVDVVVIRDDSQEGRIQNAVTYESAPVPTSVDPAVGPITGGSTHFVRGTGFASPLTVSFGAQQAEVISVQVDRIEVRIPAGSAAGAVDVSVTSGGKTGFLNNGFSYVDGTPPTVQSLSPTTGGTGGGTQVTIDGSGFADNAQVRFDGILGTNQSVSSTRIVVSTPAHALGAVAVRVTNPSTGLSAIAPSFTYAEQPAPIGGGSSGGGGCALEPEAPSGHGPLALVLVLLFVAWRRR